MGPDPDPNDPTPGMHIWGWMAPNELMWLGERAETMDSVVEVGSLHGRSAFMLLLCCPGPVYCIDPWDDEADQCYGGFMANCGHFPNLRAVRGRSPEAAKNVPTVDMTFIDGGHEYEQVLADIYAFLPKTKMLICGHDYFMPAEEAGYPGVALAVREVFGEPRVASGTSIWYVEL